MHHFRHMLSLVPRYRLLNQILHDRLHIWSDVRAKVGLMQLQLKVKGYGSHKHFATTIQHVRTAELTEKNVNKVIQMNEHQREGKI